MSIKAAITKTKTKICFVFSIFFLFFFRAVALSMLTHRIFILIILKFCLLPRVASPISSNWATNKSLKGKSGGVDKKMHAIKTHRNHLKLIIFFCSFFFTFKLKLELLVFTISEYLIKMNRIFLSVLAKQKSDANEAEWKYIFTYIWNETCGMCTHQHSNVKPGTSIPI